MGGHNIPEVVIRRRFVRGLGNLRGCYCDCIDEWTMLDNSNPYGPQLIARGQLGEVDTVVDLDFWNALIENPTWGPAT